jgi:hypothetical protein
VEATKVTEVRVTCTLPVELEPGMAYAFWLMGEVWQFQGREEEPAAPYLLEFEMKR